SRSRHHIIGVRQAEGASGARHYARFIRAEREELQGRDIGRQPRERRPQETQWCHDRRWSRPGRGHRRLSWRGERRADRRRRGYCRGNRWSGGDGKRKCRFRSRDAAYVLTESARENLRDPTGGPAVRLAAQQSRVGAKGALARQECPSYSTAPACFSFSTRAQQSLSPAAIIAVRPCVVRRFTSAPAASIISASSRFPSAAAKISGVVPFGSAAFTSAPRASSARATSVSPLTTATRSAGFLLSLWLFGSTP